MLRRTLTGLSLAAMMTFATAPTTLASAELATTISKEGEKTTLKAVGNCKVSVLKMEIKKAGKLKVQGKVSVKGTANLVLWVGLNKKYYFSRAKEVQGIKDRSEVEFSIPFNSDDKMMDDAVLQVELFDGGEVVLEDVKVTVDDQSSVKE